jgi:hypothetical protein
VIDSILPKIASLHAVAMGSRYSAIGGEVYDEYAAWALKNHPEMFLEDGYPSAVLTLRLRMDIMNRMFLDLVGRMEERLDLLVVAGGLGVRWHALADSVDDFSACFEIISEKMCGHKEKVISGSPFAKIWESVGQLPHIGMVPSSALSNPVLVVHNLLDQSLTHHALLAWLVDIHGQVPQGSLVLGCFPGCEGELEARWTNGQLRAQGWAVVDEERLYGRPPQSGVTGSLICYGRHPMRVLLMERLSKD